MIRIGGEIFAFQADMDFDLPTVFLPQTADGLQIARKILQEKLGKYTILLLLLRFL